MTVLMDFLLTCPNVASSPWCILLSCASVMTNFVKWLETKVPTLKFTWTGDHSFKLSSHRVQTRFVENCQTKPIPPSFANSRISPNTVCGYDKINETISVEKYPSLHFFSSCMSCLVSYYHLLTEKALACKILNAQGIVIRFRNLTKKWTQKNSR